MGKKGSGSEILSANVPKELYDFVKAQAKAQKRSMSFIAGQILTEWYEEQKAKPVPPAERLATMLQGSPEGRRLVELLGDLTRDEQLRQALAAEDPAQYGLDDSDEDKSA